MIHFMRSVLLIPKLYKHITRRKLQTRKTNIYVYMFTKLPHEHRCKNSKQNFIKSNPTIYKKDNIIIGWG